MNTLTYLRMVKWACALFVCRCLWQFPSVYHGKWKCARKIFVVAVILLRFLLFIHLQFFFICFLVSCLDPPQSNLLLFCNFLMLFIIFLLVSSACISFLRVFVCGFCASTPLGFCSHHLLVFCCLSFALYY